MRQALAVVTVAAGAAALLWAGYKAGQKNGVPVIASGGVPPLPPPSSNVNATLQTAIEQGAAASLTGDALDAALLAL